MCHDSIRKITAIQNGYHYNISNIPLKRTYKLFEVGMILLLSL